jgi:hypothetical protein
MFEFEVCLYERQLETVMLMLETMDINSKKQGVVVLDREAPAFPEDSYSLYAPHSLASQSSQE